LFRRRWRNKKGREERGKESSKAVKYVADSGGGKVAVASRGQLRREAAFGLLRPRQPPEKIGEEEEETVPIDWKEEKEEI
jgi:hypothetical protein